MLHSFYSFVNILKEYCYSDFHLFPHPQRLVVIHIQKCG